MLVQQNVPLTAQCMVERLNAESSLRSTVLETVRFEGIYHPS